MPALFIPVGILVASSLVILSSLSAHLFLLQALWVLIGAALIFLFVAFDWQSFFGHKWIVAGFYAFSVVLLIFVYLRGPVIRNAKSWIILGPFSFQPVEIAKIALILLYAQYFSRRHIAIARWRHIADSFLLFAVPGILVALQPNLGFTVVLFGIWFGFLLVSGLPLRRFLQLMLLFLAAGFLIWNFAMKDYQRKRIVGFLYPEQYSLSINYNVVQSKIAIGSAGLWGKGYHQGTEAQLGFLPVPESDFIFATFVEEWGFAGGFIILAAFIALLYQILRIGIQARRNNEQYICLGVAMVLCIQWSFNVGSALGLVPVAGVPLPFMSYGGTDILASFFMIAIVNAIRRENQANPMRNAPGKFYGRVDPFGF